MSAYCRRTLGFAQIANNRTPHYRRCGTSASSHFTTKYSKATVRRPAVNRPYSKVKEYLVALMTDLGKQKLYFRIRLDAIGIPNTYEVVIATLYVDHDPYTYPPSWHLPLTKMPSPRFSIPCYT